jgi:hypothetical protein
LGGRVHITEKYIKVLVVAGKVVSIEVNVGKNKYMVMSEDMSENKVTI